VAKTVDIIVPHVGEAISEVVLTKWLKQVGDPVTAGEALFLVDLDKANLEIEATDNGTLAEIRAPEGSSVMPLDVVGVLEVAG
jgi:pyruvate/2-oxoglutarate dehydrogenase complex dihydrolipoamide acyltransferase (E2) component